MGEKNGIVGMLKALGVILLVLATVSIVASFLWNWSMPHLLGAGEMSPFQAACVFILVFMFKVIPGVKVERG